MLSLLASLSLLLVFAIGVLDVVSGTELVLSPLYLLAVILATWRGGPWIGLATAIASVLTGLLGDLLLSEPYLHLANSYTSAGIPFWNAATRTLVLLTTTMTVSKLQALLRDRDHVARELKCALGQVRTLESLLSVCAWCKRIRDGSDANAWKPIECYIAEHTDSKFTHGMCPECYERVWREEGL
jgi:K+-sensing histidine kinase KdpD